MRSVRTIMSVSTVPSPANSSSMDDNLSHIVVRRQESVQKTPPTTSYRVLKLDDARFRVADRNIVTTSDLIAKLVKAGKCPVVIDLDRLRSQQPCLTSDAIKTAIEYAKGCTVIPLNKIVGALAVANALQMWGMRKAINEQIAVIASVPHIAPFAIGIAAVNLTPDWRNIIFQHVYEILDDVVSQQTFQVLSLPTIKLFVNFILEKMCDQDSDQREIARGLTKLLTTWLEGKPDQDSTHLQYVFDKIEPFMTESTADELETAEGVNGANSNGVSITTSTPRIVYEDDDGEGVELQQFDALSERSSAGGSPTPRKQSHHKTYVFRGVELPEVEPDENGVRNYAFVVEFETTKKFLTSKKQKIVRLDLDAVVECPCDGK